MSTDTALLLHEVTRIRGVRGAVLVSRSDGLPVAEALQEGVDGAAVAALVAALVDRVGRCAHAAGRAAPRLVQLRASGGAVLAAPAGDDLLLVAVTGREANVGLVRLELLSLMGTGA